MFLLLVYSYLYVLSSCLISHKIARQVFLNMHSMTAVKGCSKFHQHSELEKEDGLTGYFLLFLNGVITLYVTCLFDRKLCCFESFREVALFPLALKKFKRKMNSVAEKRSAEILMSVAERINSQLQIAECQIQADV